MGRSERDQLRAVRTSIFRTERRECTNEVEFVLRGVSSEFAAPGEVVTLAGEDYRVTSAEDGGDELRLRAVKISRPPSPLARKENRKENRKERRARAALARKKP